ncbi:hypothetical protein INF35_06475 [Subdoligranulum sp. DSM 109015]|uniref:TM2 domain-containing protein n=1 Tax=Gemmiger gallinarum TaxID=2779354 RepID=A0ABR9R2T0_9FIRM|nr:hypothetical protein [Gemmiger gallinarum]MBE5037423.1 hypothetical protein [Gemmiger gallinarum]
MKKNGFLTFCFACIPGAGQMYYGYMKRGLSLITLFCIGVGLGAIIGPLVVICPIIWMYSFFDTYDLIRRMTSGDPKPDELLLFDNLGSLRSVFPAGNRVIGWILIGLGAWALYSSIIEPILYNLFSWYFVNMVPTVVVAALLIAGGFWLLGGKRSRGGYLPPDDFPPYPGNDWDPHGMPPDQDVPGFSGMPDENLGAGSAPRWPRAGVHPTDGPRPDAFGQQPSAPEQPETHTDGSNGSC